jgi:hypothetical protein
MSSDLKHSHICRVMTAKLPFCWDRFLVEGELLFQYMKDNFNNMFEGDAKIKHFNIRNEMCYDHGSHELNQVFGKEIQKELVPWIKKELEDNRLFNNTLWKPFRDIYTLHDMYLGYRKLFLFRPNYDSYPDLLESNILRPEINIKGTYYFQLSIDAECYEDICMDCDNDITNMYNKHFELVLYNWIDDKTNKLYFNKFGPILSDNLMPQMSWEQM